VVDTVVSALVALMQRLEMREGEPPAVGKQDIFRNAIWLRAPEGGLFLSRVKPGEEVRAGQTVGVLANLLGDAELVLPSPVDGRILGLAHDQFVLPGHGVANIGTRDGSDAP